MASVISHELPLHLLEAGETGTVVGIEGRSDLVSDGLINRLVEMGLHRGARIRMVCPGSPCILEINHQRFSMRFDDSATVFVEVSR